MVLFSILLRTSKIKRHECPQLPSHIMILEAKEDSYDNGYFNIDC